MKVNDLQPAAGPQPKKASNSNGASAAPAEKRDAPEDTVSLERSREVEQAISAARVSAGAGRAANLAALEAQVRAGTYRPNPQQIAERILSAAEVDAQLRSLLD